MTKDRLSVGKNSRDRVLSDELDDLSRFEGKGGPEAPVPTTELIDVPLENRHLAETVLGDTSSKSKPNDSMKLNIELMEKNSEGVVNCAPEPTQRTGQSGAPAKASIPKRFRRLN